MTATIKLTKSAMIELYRDAHAAGHAAATACTPTPIIVGTAIGFSDEIDTDKPTYVVPDGLCGFAWINVKPGYSRFARWLVYHGYARADSYAGGVTVWVREYDQSHAKKVAYAGAFARVLRDAGITAYADDRLD